MKIETLNQLLSHDAEIVMVGERAMVVDVNRVYGAVNGVSLWMEAFQRHCCWDDEDVKLLNITVIPEPLKQGEARQLLGKAPHIGSNGFVTGWEFLTIGGTKATTVRPTFEVGGYTVKPETALALAKAVLEEQTK